MTRDLFHHDLDLLQQEILRMGGLVEKIIHDSVLALTNRDAELAKKVIEEDDQIDDLQLEVEDICLRLIARQQPMAGDLRIIGTGLKIVTDLERMADHAVDIARQAITIAQQPMLKPLIDIPRMAKLTEQMVRQCLDSYVRRDIQLAEQTCQLDDEIDHIYAQVFRELLTYMMEDPTTITRATALLFVARCLERIGDHATNIGEWVYYMVTGERKDLNN